MPELYHHGIKGQKWGVQNGPPYPLKLSDKAYKTLMDATKTYGSKALAGGAHLTKAAAKGAGGYMAMRAANKSTPQSNKAAVAYGLLYVGGLITVAGAGRETILGLDYFTRTNKQQTNAILKYTGAESMDDVYKAMNEYEKEHNMPITDFNTKNRLH